MTGGCSGRITNVFNLSTGDFFASYSLPPRRAVIACYQYYTLKNGSTWNYPEDMPEIRENKIGFLLGDFLAMKGGSDHGPNLHRFIPPQRNQAACAT